MKQLSTVKQCSLIRPNRLKVFSTSSCDIFFGIDEIQIDVYDIPCSNIRFSIVC